MKIVEVTKTESTNDNLRTKTFVGLMVGEPEIGKPLIFFSQPLDPGKDVRQIITSAVTEISGNTHKTQNSTYIIEVQNSNLSP
jgi:hypothetical protein